MSIAKQTGAPKLSRLRAVEKDVEAEILMANSSRVPGPVGPADPESPLNPAELEEYTVRLHTLLDATRAAEQPDAVVVPMPPRRGLSQRRWASGQSK